jgi:hypothetical protein
MNKNHPKKGSRITVSPIRKIKNIKKIKRKLRRKPRDLLLFTLGVNNGLRISMSGIYSMSHAFHPKTNELSGRAQSAICRLLQNRSERGLNRVTWWGGLGLKVKFENQYAEYT